MEAIELTYFKQRIEQREEISRRFLYSAIGLIAVFFAVFINTVNVIGNQKYAAEIANLNDSIHGFLDSQRVEIINEINSSKDSVPVNVIFQNEMISLNKTVSNNNIDFTKKDVFSIIFAFTFLVVGFFLAQILIKLYRYHHLMADFYRSCDDAMYINTMIENDKRKEAFESLIKALNADKINLETPNDPNFLSISDIVKK